MSAAAKGEPETALTRCAITRFSICMLLHEATTATFFFCTLTSVLYYYDFLTSIIFHSAFVYYFLKNRRFPSIWTLDERKITKLNKNFKRFFLLSQKSFISLFLFHLWRFIGCKNLFSLSPSRKYTLKEQGLSRGLVVACCPLWAFFFFFFFFFF